MFSELITLLKSNHLFELLLASFFFFFFSCNKSIQINSDSLNKVQDSDDYLQCIGFIDIFQPKQNSFLEREGNIPLNGVFISTFCGYKAKVLARNTSLFILVQYCHQFQLEGRSALICCKYSIKFSLVMLQILSQFNTIRKLPSQASV